MLCTVLPIAHAASSAVNDSKTDITRLQQQVTDTERAFAATMAKRDFAGFSTFISDEAVFMANKSLRGKQAVLNAWKDLYQPPEAPFSWAPDRVEVLDSGTLALSTGPVYNPGGKLVGRFSSIWRQDAPGVWHIIFDKGEQVSEDAKSQ